MSPTKPLTSLAQVKADQAQTTVSVLIVDDDALVRAAIRRILNNEARITVIGEAADGRSAVDAVRRLRPQVVLMDLHMPHSNGVWATSRIVAAYPQIRVLVLTAFDTDDLVSSALKAGATSFLLKDSKPEAFTMAVLMAARGERAFAVSVLNRLVQATITTTPITPVFPAAVTDRERDVASLVARGLANAEIAEELNLALSTVKTHVSALLEKFGVNNRVQLAVAVAKCLDNRAT